MTARHTEPHRRSRTVVTTIAMTLASLTAASLAHAGTYDYTDTHPCGSGQWAASWTDPSRIAQYPECPNLIVRNVLGDFRTSNGVTGEWTTNAPPTTSFVHVHLEGAWHSGPSWKSYLGESGQQVVRFCAADCGGFDLDLTPVATITTGVGCFDGRGCPNSGGAPRASVYLQQARLRVLDSTPPSVRLTGGAALANGWIGGHTAVTVNAVDNTGIQKLRPIVDDTTLNGQDNNQPCDYTRPLPCGQAPSVTVPINLSGVPDGRHRLAIAATDTGGNDVTSAARAVRVDNTAPGSPVGVQLAGGAAWRSVNAFAFAWANPAQIYAPIGGANYRICPAGAPLVSRACMSGSASGPDLNHLDIQVPGRGAWTLRLWLSDSAGNALMDNGVTIDGLRFDDTPPTGVAIAPLDTSDPARVNVHAVDPDSGVTGGSIELRRRHGRAWRPITTKVTDIGLTAVIPDGSLPRGRYQLRALATNPAGLTAGTALRSSGRKATVRLPLRTRSRLVAGRPLGRKLRRSTRLRIGRKVTIEGRLTARGKGLHRRVAISQRISIQGAHYRRVGTVRTNRHGRFRYQAPAGPARTLQFAFGGGARISDATQKVYLRVQAKLRLHVNDHSVRNGEYVTLSGRLKGGRIPPSGAQLALQFFSRGRWRAFATPRTGAHGRFRYQYRFETVQGRARFRFRAVLLKGATYPYGGRSNTVHVTVRGL
jgi:hypothetical protein